ncbi:hypothetical protein BOX15_Mlig025627g1 [Macrostomum lignano]|uniref:Malonyl-CoA:ACP transacylase (MAT) domain-containing protein n=2 Tax=Macrostomum lignano TaxID=282301 RepID=A0A267GI74_9PLAT|nr:hypothetical protein BOX15_Mlig025627g1 [Macrostomum lignano]
MASTAISRRLFCAACRFPGIFNSTKRCLATETSVPSNDSSSAESKPTGPQYEAHTDFVYRGPEGVDPADTSYILFPGQASQFVGMGSKLLQFPRTKEVFEHASEVLKYDLLKLCLSGPERKLALTQFSQPAIFVTSMAALLALEELHPDAVPRCIGTAGFSVGEFAAYTFAGTFTFEEGLRLVQVRAQAMQSVSDQIPGGMTTCLLTADADIGKAMKAARDHCQTKHAMIRPVCNVASHLYARCVVLAGHREAMQYIQQHHKDFGIASCKPLEVSGAFHTDLMYPAAKTLTRALNKCTIRVPRIPVYSNVAVKPPRTVESIAKLLVKQMHSSVKWHQIVTSLTRRRSDTPQPNVYEVGPGQQLGYILQKINNKAYAKYANVPV